MKTGIVGLPFSGKTTLFQALTGSEIDTAQYKGSKKEAHQAIIKVPDDRLDKLYTLFNPPRKVPASIEYMDLSGLGTDSSKKQGFSDQFLGQIRTVDAILVIIRAFQNENVPHPFGSIDPDRDMNFILSEFILSDLAIIENRLERLERQLRVKKDDLELKEKALLEKLKEWLESEKPLYTADISGDEEFLIRGFQFLTLKPLIIVLNVDDVQFQNSQQFSQMESKWTGPHSTFIYSNAQIEMEIQQLSPEEANEFQKDLGIEQTTINKLIRSSYNLLGLISFFTHGEDEVRAWTIRKGTRAPQAAGAIHSDFEKGFIRAEVVHYDEFIKRGSLAQCRSDGVLRLEGRDYPVKDGDIINFRFAV
jgi:hypothetical protein